MKPALLLLALLLPSCVSLKTHRKALAAAELRGMAEGQDYYLTIAQKCVEEYGKIVDVQEGLVKEFDRIQEGIHGAIKAMQK